MSRHSPSMRFVVLGSGSGGNAAVVEAAGTRLLIDAGLSAKQLVDRMRACGIEPDSLSGIVLTHEHGDHVSGLRVLAKKLAAPIYSTPSTSRIVRDGGVTGATWKIFESGASFTVGRLTIESFAVPHDAVEPVGFVFRHEERAIGLLSDTGHVTRLIAERLRGVQALFVEANYDDYLLEADTKRPWSTKQRISSRHGHLSNAQTAELVAELAPLGLRRVVLGHLSRDCNHPDTAIAAIRASVPDLLGVDCAPQDRPCGWWECTHPERPKAPEPEPAPVLREEETAPVVVSSGTAQLPAKRARAVGRKEVDTGIGELFSYWGIVDGP